MLRNKVVGAVVVLVAMCCASSAMAQQNGFAVNVGAFQLRGEDGRASNDVLVQDLNYHTFYLKDFNGATVNGEMLFGLGPFLEGSIGVGFYQRTVPAVYTDYVNDQTGADITQDFKLRVVPITAIARFLPLGRRAAIQPYIGAGVGVFSWRYTETGDFIDNNGDIFRGNFVGKGTNAGPVIVGGVRIPVGLMFAIGGEIRYQKAEGSLDATQFNGSKIDLGGTSYLFSMVVKF